MSVRFQKTPGRMVKVDRRGLVKCRVCGCTDVRACDPPCSWREDDLCSGCDDAVKHLMYWAEGANKANKFALLREFESRFVRIDGKAIEAQA